MLKWLDELRGTLRSFFDLDDDGRVELWGRRVVLRVDRQEREFWASRGRDAKPPETYLLMVQEGEDPVYEFLWRPTPTTPWEACPVVGFSRDGDATVVAAHAQDWWDAVLYTGGQLGGGTEEDLESAREEASRDAVRKADALADELDVELPDLEKLGERFEAAQDKWWDAWAEAVEEFI
jgi:hypothetical protein